MGGLRAGLCALAISSLGSWAVACGGGGGSNSSGQSTGDAAAEGGESDGGGGDSAVPTDSGADTMTTGGDSGRPDGASDGGGRNGGDAGDGSAGDGGLGDGSTGDGGTGDGGGADGGDAGILAHKGEATVAGGFKASSPHYQLVSTTGEAPGGNGTMASPGYRMVGGMVGATQGQ